MKNKQTFLAIGSLVGGLLLLVGFYFLFAQAATAAAASSLAASQVTAAEMPLIDDFESGLPPNNGGATPPNGWIPYTGGGSIITTTAISSSLPGQPINTAAAITYTITGGGWGGVSRTLPASQDWSDYDGIGFWLYGTNSGRTLEIQVFDNRSNNSIDTSERFVAPLITDNFTGWKYFTLPWATFNRNGWQPDGAPNDGFTLTQMWGYNMAFAAGVSGSIYIDQVKVIKFNIIDDFESGLPPNNGGATPPNGWIPYTGGGSIITTTAISSSLPGQPINTAAAITYTITGGGWGGVSRTLPASQDWSDYDGIGFWLYGTNSGRTLEIQVFDNRSNNSIDTSERFVAPLITDNFTGWKYFTLPWAAFNRNGWQPDGAPNDGFTLTQMWGYNMAFAAGVSGSIYIDDAGPYGGNAGAGSIDVQFSQMSYSVVEGETAVVAVSLTAPAIYTATVNYATSAGTAMPGEDYTSASGQLSFAVGSTTVTFTVPTLDDAEAEGNETVILTLSDPVSATLGSNNPATLVIDDNDAAQLAPQNVALIDSFSGGLPDGVDGYGNTIGFIPWTGGGAAITLTTPSVSVSDPLSLPVQTGDNELLQIDSNVGAGWAGYTHLFTNAALDTWLSQDWTPYEGVSFWVYGSGSGGDLNIDIFDNKTTTGDSCERWTYIFADDFTGWRYFAVPFGDFVRKSWQPGGAPNDGLTLTEVWGYAFGFPANVGARTYFIDNVGVMLRTTIVDDFDNGVPSGSDSFGNTIGFVTWGSTTNTFLTTTQVISTSPLAFPLPLGGNEFLQVDYDIASGGWGGFTHLFTNAGVDTWINQNWVTYEGISFWVYGSGSGGDLNIDIFDNKTTTGDSCERWTYIFADDFTGWRYFAVPFGDFVRKSWQPGGAPNDGLTLTEVWGYAFGFPANVNARTNYLELFTVYGSTTPPAQDPKVSFGAMGYSAVEGQSASISIRLNVALTTPVTVSYATGSGTAISNRDYLAVAGSHTFAPGETEFVFNVETLDDIKYEGNEAAGLQLSDAVGAELGSISRVDLAIQDNDPFNPLLIDDFETIPYAFDAWGNIELSMTEIVSPSSMALPGQWQYENVLGVNASDSRTFTPAGSGFSRTFVESEDWRSADGLEFWYYGQNSGEKISVTLQGNRQSDPGPSGWTLVWSDEFEGAGGSPVNQANWTHEIGGHGWGNAEWEYYTDSTENSSVDGSGNLVITAREIEDGAAPLECWYGDCTHTSARLVTANKFEFTYGRAEARLKVPYGQGIWPAFWTLGNDIGTVGWPGCGEIDIMENIGREPNIVHGTIHGPGYSGGSGIGGAYTLESGNLADDFHVFAIEWEPEEIRWYIDGTQYFTVTVNDIPAGTEWVYDHPFFLILNVAVGGYWPGYPDASTVFPQMMTVDYVRVYQGPDTAERHEALFTDNFSGWQEVRLPFTAFNRSTQQPENAPDDGFDLAEIWGYGFGLPAGAEQPVYIDQVARFSGATAQPTVQFSASDYTVDEGGVVTITVTLDVSSSAPVSVTYTTVDGSALAGSDYLTSTGTLVFAPGEMSKTFQVTTRSDDTVEGSETVILRLSEPQGATLGTPHEASLVIQDTTTRFVVYLPLIFKP
ncbi:MAG: carbohydrate binding domain-containing protein [Chloroflexota bacterium]